MGPEGPVYFPDPFDRRTATDFHVLVPPRFDRDFLETLVLVLDLAHAEEVGADNILVPVMLDVKDRRKEDVLAKVQIRLAEGKTSANIRFRKKG